MGKVGRKHRVEADLTERPAARRQGVSRSLRVVNDQVRGLCENVGHSPLLRWAEFGGVNNERVIGTSEDEARDVAAGRAYIAFDKESEGRSR